MEGNSFQLVSCLPCLFPFNLPNTLKLVKTAELPPDRNYVVGCHPHGIMCMGTFCNFFTEANNFSKQFPGIQTSPVTLAFLLHLPVYRDYLMYLGKPQAEWEEGPLLPSPHTRLPPTHPTQGPGLNIGLAHSGHQCMALERVSCILVGKGIRGHTASGMGSRCGRNGVWIPLNGR